MIRLQQYEKGQAPERVVIACSDARVHCSDNPFLKRKDEFGGAFVIRTAGQLLDEAGWESLRYAVQNLPSVKEVIVMGHNRCGAVKAYEKRINGLPFFLTYIGENIRYARALGLDQVPYPEGFTEFEALNALGQAAAVAERVRTWREDVIVTAGLYDLRDGTYYPLLHFLPRRQ
ncbi:MAG: carbonic anhydrase [Candidatus Micrarchaeota archaeon]|nr:carbonic anhydrase [Candidatus Micrarchaeota archaeon]